jgi:hypothetical protein
MQPKYLGRPVERAMTHDGDGQHIRSVLHRITAPSHEQTRYLKFSDSVSLKYAVSSNISFSLSTA